MKPRAKKKKLKKLFPYSNEFKQHKKGYKKRLHNEAKDIKPENPRGFLPEGFFF